MVRVEQLPDGMLGYATYELAELLGQLNQSQRAAIGRIVEHVYIANRPMSELLRGDDKICGEAFYYRRGKLDPDTGAWARKPGWAHDEAFAAALAAARRLALAARSREETAALAEAKRRARLATPGVVQRLEDIVQASEKDSDRVNASKVILDYAGQPDEAGQGESSAEADWWEAVGDGD